MPSNRNNKKQSAAPARILHCHKGIGEKVSGEALVANDDFSARYDLDRIKGIFSRPGHQLFGQSYKDKILVLNTAKGGVASAWMLHEMRARGIAPKAILFNSANTILAQGAALAGMPLCDRFTDGDITTLIRSGQMLDVDPQAGLVTLRRG